MNRYCLAISTRSLKHCLLTLKFYLELYASETIMNVYKVLKAAFSQVTPSCSRKRQRRRKLGAGGHSQWVWGPHCAGRGRVFVRTSQLVPMGGVPTREISAPQFLLHALIPKHLAPNWEGSSARWPPDLGQTLAVLSNGRAGLPWFG